MWRLPVYNIGLCSLSKHIAKGLPQILYFVLWTIYKLRWMQVYYVKRFHMLILTLFALPTLQDFHCLLPWANISKFLQFLFVIQWVYLSLWLVFKYILPLKIKEYNLPYPVYISKNINEKIFSIITNINDAVLKV